MHHIKPTIQKRKGTNTQGKGFSRDELKKAGVNKNTARKIGLPIDEKRKTAHDDNVENIKAHVAAAKAQEKPKPQKPVETKKK